MRTTHRRAAVVQRAQTAEAEMQKLVAQTRQHQSHVESVGAVHQDALVNPDSATTQESNIVSADSSAQLLSQVCGHVAGCCQGIAICKTHPLPNFVHHHRACLILHAGHSYSCFVLI